MDLLPSNHDSLNQQMDISNVEPEDEALNLNFLDEDPKVNFPYMKNIIKASSAINMWPNTKRQNVFLYHFLIWIMIIHNVLFVLTFAIKIINEFSNMDSIATLVDFVTVFISGTFRYIYMYIRGERYIYLVSKIHNNFIEFPFFPSKDKVTLEKYYKIGNRLIIVYTCFTFFWMLQISLSPLISYLWKISIIALSTNQTELENIPYPVSMKVYAPFDYYKQPQNALFYIYQVIGFMMYGYIYITVDSFWYMLILLSIGQLVMIEDSLHSIAEHLKKHEALKESQLWDKNRVKKVEEGLTKCIKHHQFLREFLLEAEDLNNPNVLIDALHAAISIGFILLDTIISLNTGDFNKVMYSIEYLATSVVHMFSFDWLATRLNEQEEKLADAAYDILWYKCPSLKVHLMMLILQARRPCKLTGGKMYQLSLGFFASMLRAIFSYFMFLFQMRNSKSDVMQ